MNHARFLNRPRMNRVGLALTLAALTSWMALQIPGIAPSLASTQNKSGGAIRSKQEIWDRMIELDSIVSNLKNQLAANPKDKELLARIDAALTEYDQLSAALGGDRPSSDLSAIGAPAKPAAPSVIPPVPTGCVAATATFSNMTPVAIPDNNPTGITSTINVVGAGTFIWDVNVTVNITHTFASDLDFTLTSPSGTVVTLSTDQDGGSDNVFAGTTFDDQADPGSQIPYAVNPNIATDHTYTNLVVATPLTPEEPLSAFNGQNPNGTWSLKVIDDAGADLGTLNSWSVEITTFTAAPVNSPPVIVSNMTPVAIPDNNPTGVTSTINVAGAGTSICDVNVTVNITHTFASDLDFTLTSPSGTVVTLSTDQDGGSDNVFAGTTFDDQADPGSQIPYAVNPNIATDHTYTNLVVATPLTPEEPLSAFNGQNPNGTWTLKVVDDAGGDLGTINSWSLSITTCACAAACVLTCPANQVVSNDPNQCGAVVNYPAPTTTGGCGTVTCSPPSGSFFPVGTTTVTCSSSGGGASPAEMGAGAAFPVPDGGKAPRGGGGKGGSIGGTGGAINTGGWPTTSNSGGGVPKGSGSFPQSTLAILYDQTNNPAPVPGGVTSQNFEMSFDPFDCETADDFVVPAGQTWTVQQVFVVGEYGAGLGPATSANVVFYSDSATLPGGAVYTATNQTFADVAGDLTINLAVPAILTPGTYWVSVQANENFTPNGQWFWDNRTAISNSGAAWRNPGGGFGVGCTSFGRKTTCLPTQNGPDQLFQLLGTSTVLGGGPSCTFTVKVNDTQPPSITCPANVTTVTDQNACPPPACVVVNFPPPVATDNCPGVLVVCTPPAGSCLPTGVTTVTCTATDGSGNTATCSFTVSVFDTALQDDSNPANILFWNSITGAYRFCCNGTTFTGVGKSTIQGCVFTLQHDPADRRLLGRVDKAVHSGTAALQAPAGTIRCTITDRNTLNDTLLPACQ